MANPFKDQTEVKVEDFLAEVHRDLWEEDTMHEFRVNDDGSIDIVETVHSMNSDFSRTVVTVGTDGIVINDGGSETADYCKKKKIKIVV